MSTNKQRTMLHIKVGTDQWNPTDAEVDAIVKKFKDAEVDNKGRALVGTRKGVEVEQLFLDDAPEVTSTAPKSDIEPLPMQFFQPDSGIPVQLSLWKHRNGNIYRVLLITNMQSTKEEYPVTVVYEGYVNREIWSRPLSTWHSSMTQVYEK
jgi:hypothetical protein